MNNLDSDIKSLRLQGKSCNSIYYELRSKYNVTRYEIKSRMRSLGLMMACSHGGYRPGSGRGHKYLLDGIIYDSYAELCFYLINKDKLQISKNYRSFSVNGHNYTPDFVGNDGKYYEIKSDKCNDLWGWNLRKLEGFESNLVIVTKNDLIPIISEVKLKYGEEYINSLMIR